MSLEHSTDVYGNNAVISQELVEEITASVTLLNEDSGKTYLVGTDALVITLPATKKGLRFKFMNSGAAGNNIITVSPVAADGISGTITLAATVVVDAGVIDKDIINTKVSSEAGDSLEIVGTGVAGITAWLIGSSTGIWSVEA